MDTNEANALLRRYLEGNASSGEIQLVEQWYQELADAGEWNWAEGERERLEGAIESRLLRQMRAEERPVRKISAVRWVAAAVFVLLAGAGTWLLLRNKTGESTMIAQQQRFKNDVGPGRNAAILTLAGGKEIVLDSSATGTIGKQNNAVIVNNNGQLIYKTLHEKPTGIFFNTLTTPRGSQYQMILPDGSKVWLNAASSITYPVAFGGERRVVTITGEAYFEVAKNEAQPFVVQEGDMSVQVLGTHFDVNGYADEADRKTMLLEGSVRILDKGSNSLLKPGQQAVLDRHDDKIQIVDHPNVEAVMAWKNGTFLFEDATIESIMRQVARWYDVEVVYNTSISKHFVADIPRNVPLSRLLELLELTDQVHFRIEGKKITVIP